MARCGVSGRGRGVSGITCFQGLTAVVGVLWEWLLVFLFGVTGGVGWWACWVFVAGGGFGGAWGGCGFELVFQCLGVCGWSGGVSVGGLSFVG